MQAQGEIGVASGDLRFKLGMAIFVFAFAIWLLLPLMAALNASAATLVALSGVLFIANKVLVLSVVAVMGKPGFQQLKRHVFGYVTMLAAPPELGRLRHSLGLLMFGLPLFASFLEQYMDHVWPEFWPHRWQLQLLGDLIFIGSFFVLGGNFWDKMRALFVRTARVVDLGVETAATSLALVRAMPR